MKRLIALLPVMIAFQAGVPPALAWTWPVDGPVLQEFTLGDDPYARGQHRGVDLEARLGDPVRAPAPGNACVFANDRLTDSPRPDPTSKRNTPSTGAPPTGVTVAFTRGWLFAVNWSGTVSPGPEYWNVARSCSTSRRAW